VALFFLYKKEKIMPEDNKKDTPQKGTDLPKENTSEQEQTIHVHNPFTGKDVEVTQEQLDNV
jgi:hypothetical protein